MFRIFNKDYQEIIKQIPDNSIDLILTDPPYKVTSRGNSGTMGGIIKDPINMKGRVFNFNDVEIEDYINEFYRILKPNHHCYIFCNQKNIYHFLKVINEETSFKWFKNLIWLKDNKIANQYYMTQFEYILFLRKGKARKINHCGTSEVLNFANKKTKTADGQNVHPTEKPVDLLKCLIDNSTQPNEVVFDPFFGSGNTGVASLQLNRNFVGCEIDETYFNYAKDNLKKVGNNGEITERQTSKTD